MLCSSSLMFDLLAMVISKLVCHFVPSWHDYIARSFCCNFLLMYGQLDMLLNLSYYSQNCDDIIYLTLEGGICPLKTSSLPRVMLLILLNWIKVNLPGCIYTHACMHTHTHTCARTHTHTYTHKGWAVSQWYSNEAAECDVICLQAVVLPGDRTMEHLYGNRRKFAYFLRSSPVWLLNIHNTKYQ